MIKNYSKHLYNFLLSNPRACIFLLLLVTVQSAFCQVESIAEKLVNLGFENVRCIETEDERIFTIENNTYRVTGIGIAHALQIIKESPEIQDNKSCKLIVTKLNVPQIQLSYTPGAEKFTEGPNPEDWKVSYELYDSWKKVKKEKKKNSSLFKVDILVYPQLALKNLIINQIYQILFELNPAVEVSLLPGMKLTAQLKLPIYNDGYSYLDEKVHPGYLTLSQNFRIPFHLFNDEYSVFGRATVGYFNSDRYGIDLNFLMPFKDERFSAEARLSYVGVGYWNGFKLHYDSHMNFLWQVGANFYWPKFNTQFSLKALHFIGEDVGFRFDMIRHFRYASIGFYGLKGWDSTYPKESQYRSVKLNGGFRFQVLLPPYKYKRFKNKYKYLPRINTSPNMGIAYNAGNEQRYYREFRSESSDNIMDFNKFNPIFIKSEITNY